MRRMSVVLVSVVVGGLAAVMPAARAQAPMPPIAATPENAAPFLGDWTLSADGSYGPATFDLTLKVTDGKVQGEISSVAVGKQAIADISRTGPSLMLRYVFDYQGNPVNAIITLTPGDNTINAHLDFADGAAQMTGTATKKPS